jgi:anthranilate phosphoribosyltransferase
MIRAMNLLLAGKSLTREHAEQAMSLVLDGAVTPEQIGAFLIALRLKSESIDEISGFVDCLGKRAIPVVTSRSDVMDVCGTGGDCSGTFNVSTAVAFVVAAAGQPIAKHGNRSVSSRSGSFDVLEALGLKFELDPALAARSIEEHGIGLLFAPAFHPSLKILAPIRRNLGVPTIFNALGPLLNPARVKRQLVGVYSPLLLNKAAEVLRAQGSEEAMVVRGEEGLDEISLCGSTQVAHLKDGKIRNYVIQPEDFGLKRAEAAQLKGGDAQENARIMVGILKGAQKGDYAPKRDFVLLNAGAALVVGGKASDFKDGVRKAAQAIDSGRAVELIRKMGANV